MVLGVVENRSRTGPGRKPLVCLRLWRCSRIRRGFSSSPLMPECSAWALSGSYSIDRVRWHLFRRCLRLHQLRAKTTRNEDFFLKTSQFQVSGASLVKKKAEFFTPFCVKSGQLQKYEGKARKRRKKKRGRFFFVESSKLPVIEPGELNTCHYRFVVSCCVVLAFPVGAPSSR